jgi:hypothetical protein
LRRHQDRKRGADPAAGSRGPEHVREEIEETAQDLGETVTSLAPAGHLALQHAGRVAPHHDLQVIIGFLPPCEHDRVEDP